VSAASSHQARQLASGQSPVVSVVHRRAAAWHRQAGNVEETVGHVTAAGGFAQANALIARHWLAYRRRGRHATVARWLDGLSDEAITADPAVAFRLGLR
jgi:LuxR family maltose regulon positive regulatory protein